MGKSLLSISPFKNVSQPKIPGYLVASTAPLNVEGDRMMGMSDGETVTTPQEAQQQLEKIAEILYQKTIAADPTEFVELIISIHGFSNSREVALNRFQEIYEYINADSNQPFQESYKNLVYIGYRWPSEALFGNGENIIKKIASAVTALPLLPRFILVISFIGLLLPFIPTVRQVFFFSPFYFLGYLLFLLLAFLFYSIFTLVLLRLIVYFQDRYRATNYGVPDLVEFLRQLDKLILSKTKAEFINEISLTKKLREQLKARVQKELEAEKTNIVNEEIFTEICDRAIKDYCKKGTLNSADYETIGDTPSHKEEVRKILARVEQILTQEEDTEIAKLRDKTINILEQRAIYKWKKRNRIKISFLGHSMGGYVVTHVVRILSDVFDLRSIGTLGLEDKIPSPNVGSIFRLGRLVLVSPDIPINTILSGRANFLRSSLRRFEETYLFSNEGDLALRLASTLANYFTFPARTRESGYRLGNVAIQDKLGYGIVNLANLKRSIFPETDPKILNKLFVDSFELEKSLADIQSDYHSEKAKFSLKQLFHSFLKKIGLAKSNNIKDSTHPKPVADNQIRSNENIAELFTYFDCTDYTGYTLKRQNSRQRVLTLKRGNWEPKWLYYLRLIFAYAFGIKDTHGGYFEGIFTRKLMYRLTFLGFAGLLDSFVPEQSQELQPPATNNAEQLRDIRLVALAILDEKCEDKKIQVLLSPERYEVGILGRDRALVRRQILNPKPTQEATPLEL